MTAMTTPRLILRPLAASDAARIEELINDYEIARWLAQVPHPYPKGGALEFIASIKPDHLVIAVCLKDGALIGCLSLLKEKKTGRLGYWLGKAFGNKGYMAEALSAFLHRIFQQDGLDKVTAGVMVENAASWRLQEKLGFKRTEKTKLYSLARDEEVPAWETELTREDYRKLHP